MKNVMKKAWEIAKEGVKKFGGKVTEYFAEALRMAWKIAKYIAAHAELTIPADTRKCRTWVARITGTHPVYKLNREFINHDHDDEYGDKVFRLANGFYEYNNGRSRGFIQVLNGDKKSVERADVIAHVAALEH
ncbi:hypothetical protein ERIC1_2c00110 [Paenibacillus larvae subsp. larvae DSM 25719]|uniref:hypothetical protein n=1 Tax=Paenibacillus larvae TaxID=1464 RepID=UPI0003DDC7B4|nr:hypothetical protein [Paenibacillus larvae]ETK25823.1 hypothetical protein ERIC1_2c00110 [Paenibacillus larvae subsp. larvae DSM 25719]